MQARRRDSGVRVRFPRAETLSTRDGMGWGFRVVQVSSRIRVETPALGRGFRLLLACCCWGGALDGFLLVAMAVSSGRMAVVYQKARNSWLRSIPWRWVSTTASEDPRYMKQSLADHLAASRAQLAAPYPSRAAWRPRGDRAGNWSQTAWQPEPRRTAALGQPRCCPWRSMPERSATNTCRTERTRKLQCETVLCPAPVAIFACSFLTSQAVKGCNVFHLRTDNLLRRPTATRP